MTNRIEYDDILNSIDKNNAFSKIAELFYKRNFSTTSKAEIELLMFHFYMQALIKMCTDEQTNVLDYKKCSDYNIAKQLGITEGRVRNLKVKVQARYPEAFDWKKSFESLKNNVRYDEKINRIIIPVPDPNLYLELKNFIEENGGYIEVRRSGNYIQIRPEYYIFLIYDSVSEDDKKKVLKEITCALNKKNSSPPISIDSRTDMINHILGITENSLSILASLVEKIKCPLTVAISLINVISKIAKLS